MRTRSRTRCEAHETPVIRRRLATRPAREGPITKLPAELLCDIFLYIRDSEIPLQHAQARFAERMFSSWLVVTKVCRYWRSVSLNFNQLWNVLLVMDSPQFRMFVARSQRAPLSITCLHQLSSARSLASILTELPRIRHLTFRGPKAWLDTIRDETTAPLLETLSLTRTDANVLANDICLPSLFTKGSFPLLRKLEISGYHVQWQNTVFCSTLRYLRITSWYGRPQTLAETIVALGNLPLLEELDLHRMLPTTDGLGPTPRPITLAHLRQLRIADNAMSCARALDCIMFPGSTSITIECQCFPGDPSSMPMISSALRKKLLGTDGLQKPEPLVNLAVEQRSLGPRQHPAMCTLTVCGWTALRSSEHTHRTSAAECANLRVLLFSGRTYTALDLCRGWPLNDVRKLFLFAENCAQEEITEMWTGMATTLVPKLTVLSVTGSEIMDALPELLQIRLPIAHPDGEAVQTRSGLPRTRAILPELETLMLPLDSDRTTGSEELATLYATSLCNSLRARKRAGVQIRELIISSCKGAGFKKHSEMGKVVGQFLCLQCG